MGDPIAGGSVYWLSDNVDGGPIAAQDWCFVEPGVAPDEIDVVASQLWRKELFPMGIRLLRETFDALERHIIVEVPQDELYATWEPSWERPPLHRPDLPQIGGVPGYQHITRRVT
jgi:methionyl-tRNA formyltransferase